MLGLYGVFFSVGISLIGALTAAVGGTELLFSGTARGSKEKYEVYCRDCQTSD